MRCCRRCQPLEYYLSYTRYTPAVGGFAAPPLRAGLLRLLMPMLDYACRLRLLLRITIRRARCAYDYYAAATIRCCHVAEFIICLPPPPRLLMPLPLPAAIAAAIHTLLPMSSRVCAYLIEYTDFDIHHTRVTRIAGVIASDVLRERCARRCYDMRALCLLP